MENSATVIGNIKFKALKIGDIYIFPIVYATRSGFGRVKAWAVVPPNSAVITDEYDKWFLALETLLQELQNAIGKTVEYVEVEATMYKVDEVIVVTWGDKHRIAVRRLVSLGFK